MAPEIILVAEEPAALQLFGLVLRWAGFRTRLVRSGRQAIHCFRTHRDTIRLIISDLDWPTATCSRTLAKMQELKPSLRFCFLGGSALRFSAADLWQLHPGLHLRKPFPLEDFVTAVAALLAQTVSG